MYDKAIETTDGERDEEGHSKYCARPNFDVYQTIQTMALKSLTLSMYLKMVGHAIHPGGDRGSASFVDASIARPCTVSGLVCVIHEIVTAFVLLFARKHGRYLVEH